MKRILLPAFIIFSLFFLSGCGFHLRQPIAVQANLPAIQITSQLKNPQQLLMVKKYLSQTGFSISETNAPILLQLLSMKLETRPYSYTALAKVAEYQLVQTLNYQLFNDHHQPLSPIIEIYADRIYPVDQQNLSGNHQENSLIQEELKNNVLKELAEQLNQTLKYIDQSKQGS